MKHVKNYTGTSEVNNDYTRPRMYMINGDKINVYCDLNYVAIYNSTVTITSKTSGTYTPDSNLNSFYYKYNLFTTIRNNTSICDQVSFYFNPVAIEIDGHTAIGTLSIQHNGGADYEYWFKSNDLYIYEHHYTEAVGSSCQGGSGYASKNEGEIYTKFELPQSSVSYKIYRLE